MKKGAQNCTLLACPLYGADGAVSGWFKFPDKYLQPEVLYGSWPPVTTVKLGGRTLEADRPSAVKIKLLEPREDRDFWCSRRQHGERVNLGEYHRDFGDVEVAYSFSSPQTHVWFAGYSIHFEAFENLAVHSYNATVRVRPEHLLDRKGRGRRAFLNDGSPARTGEGGGGGEVAGRTATGTRAMLLQSHLLARSHGSPSSTHTYPTLYSTQVPLMHDNGLKPCAVDYVYTPVHLNDCERSIHFREEVNVGAEIARLSSPVSVPPVYPPLDPYEVPELVFSAADARARRGYHVTDVVQRLPPGRARRDAAERRRRRQAAAASRRRGDLLPAVERSNERGGPGTSLIPVPEAQLATPSTRLRSYARHQYRKHFEGRESPEPWSPRQLAAREAIIQKLSPDRGGGAGPPAGWTPATTPGATPPLPPASGRVLPPTIIYPAVGRPAVHATAPPPQATASFAPQVSLPRAAAAPASYVTVYPRSPTPPPPAAGAAAVSPRLSPVARPPLLRPKRTLSFTGSPRSGGRIFDSPPPLPSAGLKASPLSRGTRFGTPRSTSPVSVRRAR